MKNKAEKNKYYYKVNGNSIVITAYTLWEADKEIFQAFPKERNKVEYSEKLTRENWSK